MSARGLTLVEVLVATAVLALAVLALARLAAGAARAERTAGLGREAADWLRDELALQRSVRLGACGSRPIADGWSCSVDRRCGAACDLETVRVTITAPDGRVLEGASAVWWALERAPAGERP